MDATARESKMNEEELKRIIELAESRLNRAAKRIRELVFNEDYIVLINEYEDLVEETKLDLDLIAKSSLELDNLLRTR